MKIRFMSDLHCEFDLPAGIFTIPEHEDDGDTVLVLAGDIGVAKKPQSLNMIYKQTDRFALAVSVMGNHEHYYGDIDITPAKIHDMLATRHNHHLLEMDFVIHKDVAFIGATMWSDFQGCNALIMNEAAQFMNDYHEIRTDHYRRKIDPLQIFNLHQRSVKYIFDSIRFHKSEGRKVVVVTHMGPSWQSVHPKFKGDKLNGCYVTDLEEEIIETKPDLWIHGHVHTNFDYMVGDTRVVVNPRGYVGYQLNSDFDRDMVIEI